MKKFATAFLTFVLLVIVGVGTVFTAPQRPKSKAKAETGDKGESKEMMALKGRRIAPKPDQIDLAVTLDALIGKSGPKDWSTAKGATVTGYVTQVEKEEDGDMHIVLATNANETDTKKWVIVEATPAWRQKKPAMAESKLRKLVGKQVRVTGWLYYEPDAEDQDPRGTRWEIHPITDLVVIK